jgi:hypothetical protein
MCYGFGEKKQKMIHFGLVLVQTHTVPTHDIFFV